jgi:hypothetical protein
MANTDSNTLSIDIDIDLSDLAAAPEPLAPLAAPSEPSAHRRRRPVALLLATLALGACGAGGAATGPAGGGTPSSGVEETLSRLGVPLDKGPRLGSDGQPVAADFDPLGNGNQTIIEKKDELFALGMQMPIAAGATSDGASVLTLDEGAPTWWLDVTSPSAPPWAMEKSGLIRAAAAGNVDGDGAQQVIVVSASNTPDASGSTEIDLSIVDDVQAPAPFAFRTAKIASLPNVTALSVAAADFDGDDKIDLAVGVTSAVQLQGPAANAQAQVLFFKNTGGGTFTLVNTTTVVAATAGGPSQATLVLAPAQLDGDRPSELALVANTASGTNDNLTYAAHYYVYDDAKSGFVSLGDGPIGSQTDPVVSADIATGDIDGDGLDEIVLGGPDAIAAGCTPNIVAVALDDATHKLAPLSAPNSFHPHWGDCGGDGLNAPSIAWAPVRVLQADTSNAAKEILIGDTIFNNMTSVISANGHTDIDNFTVLGTLPANAYIGDSDTSDKFNPTTASVVIATAEANGPLGGDEVLVYTQDSNKITAYALTCAVDSTTKVFGCKTAPQPSVATTFMGPSANGPSYPILVPVDFDGDSVTLERTDLTHNLVFTQPIVIAAMAAPPCENGIGQNTSACVSTYGTATSSEEGQEQDSSQSVSVTAGVHIDGGLVGDLTAKATVTATASSSIGSSYTLTRQVTYSSGSMEDSVVFATVPYDQYHYTVLSGRNAGTPLTVSIPRAPVVLIAERSFYNSTVVPGSLTIDDKVFRHTIGDISTYPTLADEGALPPGQVLVGDLSAAGQGGGSTTLTDEVERDMSISSAVEFDEQFDVEATAGVVLLGFGVGTSVTDSLSVTMGQNTSFSGTVGSIDAAHFSDSFYQFNMFAYTQTDPTSKEAFQVVNYWVQ